MSTFSAQKLNATAARAALAAMGVSRHRNAGQGRSLHEGKAFFVTRPNHNTQLRISSSMPSSAAIRSANAAAGICTDFRIRLTGEHTASYYPETQRRVHLHVPDTRKHFALLTHNFKRFAVAFAALYKARCTALI